jgi:hypothetical protein
MSNKFSKDKLTIKVPFQPAMRQVHLRQPCSGGELDVLVVFQLAHALVL